MFKNSTIKPDGNKNKILRYRLIKFANQFR